MATNRTRAGTRGRRKDPSPRNIDGSAPWSKLKNRDPRRHYTLVYSGDGADQGVEHYRSIGYVVEEASADGVALQAGTTVAMGQPITMRGHVLMSCSQERYEEIEQYGADGDTGQAYANEVEERIVSRTGGRDLLRGLHGPRGLGAVSEIEAMQSEG